LFKVVLLPGTAGVLLGDGTAGTLLLLVRFDSISTSCKIRTLTTVNY
jgi:hypothetical protein